MAKKKGLAKTVRRRTPKKNAEGPQGEGIAHDLQHVFLPGFGGYVGNRFAARLVYQATLKRAPNAARHAAALSTVVGAAAAYYGASRVEAIAPYQGPIALGASVGALQTLAQTYLPGYGWMVSDIRAEDYEEAEAPEPAEGYFPSGRVAGRSSASAGDEAAAGDDGDIGDVDDLSDLDDGDGDY